MADKVVHMIEIPAKQIPAWKYRLASADGVKQIMMTTYGGLGDVVCAEPALRHAFTLFPEYEISLLCDYPDLFSHLPFKRVYSSAEAKSFVDSEWIIIHTNAPDGNMPRDFLMHHFTQCVDFSTLCAFQKQLPVWDRQITLVGQASPQYRRILVHPGRHWLSKTFPKEWWNEVLKDLVYKCGADQIAIIGQDVNDKRGTVDVDVPDGVLDLRNMLTVKQLISVCQKAEFVITNDSAPLHIASSGEATILFIASCKEPEYLMHWRDGKFGWNMRNLGRDGLWNHQSECPIRSKALEIDKLPDGLMEDILPDPKTVSKNVYLYKGLEPRP